MVVEKKENFRYRWRNFKCIKKFKKQIFLVLNPDTIWRKGYKKEFRKLEKVYLKNKKPTMLLVSKTKVMIDHSRVILI